MVQGPYRTDLLNHLVEVDIKVDEVENFKQFMRDYLPATSTFPGCEFIYLMQASSAGNKFFFFETWESQERLNAYHAWRGHSQELAKMFASPPKAHLGHGVFSASPPNDPR